MMKNAKENNLIKNKRTSLERLESTSSLSSDRHQLKRPHTLLQAHNSGKFFKHQANKYFLTPTYLQVLPLLLGYPGVHVRPIVHQHRPGEEPEDAETAEHVEHVPGVRYILSVLCTNMTGMYVLPAEVVAEVAAGGHRDDRAEGGASVGQGSEPKRGQCGIILG